MKAGKVSNPESTNILDNSTVISPLSCSSTKRAAEDYKRRISGSYPVSAYSEGDQMMSVNQGAMARLK